MITYRQEINAPATRAWEHIARPRLWPGWAPHLRGAWGLGDPEVEPGRWGAVRLAGVLPVPARIVAKAPGRSWTWVVGPYEMEHRIEGLEGGCVAVIEIRAHPALERILAATYGPIVALLLRRLAAVVETPGRSGHL